MQALLRAADRPLAAPSANASGSISPTRASHVLKSLGGRIGLIIDGGPTKRGLESTIIAATGGPLRLLRPGPLQIQAELGSGSTDRGAGPACEPLCAVEALRLNAATFGSRGVSDRLRPVQGDANLSRGGDLVEAASRLFDLLHEADSSPKQAHRGRSGSRPGSRRCDQ